MFPGFLPIALRGLLEHVLIIDYTGDDANNREIDLGGVYDVAILFPRSSFLSTENHAALAYAVRGSWGIFTNGAGGTGHRSGAATVNYFKGFGEAFDKVVLGANGASTFGTNVSGVLYLILALRFKEVTR